MRAGFGSVPSLISRARARPTSRIVATPVQLSFAPGVAMVSNACATRISSPAFGSVPGIAADTTFIFPG